MTAALAIALLDFLSGGDPSARAADASPALVVVALPANASQAILEALNRLRGEATSVGFEVRFVEAGSETVSPDQLAGLGHGLRPAAVVAFSGSRSSTEPKHSLDVLFLDRVSGKTSIEHFAVDTDEGAGDRGEVILAVRAVDFIRARMLDALVKRSAAGQRSEQPTRTEARASIYVAAGVSVLGTFSGLAPWVAPEVDAGYSPMRWLRFGVSGFGFGTSPSASSIGGQVELDQRYLGAQATLFGPEWHRLRPAFELGGGWYWLKVRGVAREPYQATPGSSSSAALSVACGGAWAIGQHFSADLRGGTLWLQDQPQINGTVREPLASMGRPSWFVRALAGLVY